ncbi:hypothetical protein F4804DRAFT_35580 [Jackrogersella minutella]|nr:hypothetical protein F4804DRAFT_35580 [Jackrogersella minutella]
MAYQNNNPAPWGGAQEVDENGIQSKPMGLKVLYTFDTGCQERCLARWPHIITVQTIMIEEHSMIGVVQLRVCLQAIAQCSPELINDNEKDYTIYASDYSEPGVPLVGQGMLSWALEEESASPNTQSKFVTGCITKNPLAVFGNGVKDTLEVKLKLTAVSRIARRNPLPNMTSDYSASNRTSTPTPSEHSEWTSFRQSNSNLAPSRGATVEIAAAPIRPAQPNYDVRRDAVMPNNQGPWPTSGSRPASVEPTAREPQGPTLIQNSGIAEKQSTVTEGFTTAPAPTKGGKSQSRPASRASSRPPSGRPRGRPRKKPLVAEGSTSGIEDATDADDRPPQSKKRATTTKVQRNNTATFGSTTESLRVAASTAGSIRNFRPVAITGDPRTGNHIQEVPRAPTPVPAPCLPGFPHARPTASSGLRRESIPGTGVDQSFTSSYPGLNRSVSYSQDARSPADSAGVSPCQIYSDEASPADIGSSPPVPRSALYSAQSSPTPSSPILPPMPSARIQPDSGYMSGRLDSSRVEDDSTSRVPVDVAPTVPKVAKPKPRRSRAKKAPVTGQSDLIIHTETPGPPELLPQTSIYNPPHLIRKNSEAAKTSVVSEALSFPTLPGMPSEPLRPEMIETQPVEKAMPLEERATPMDMMSLETTPMDFTDDQHQQYADSQSLASHSFTPAPEEPSNHDTQPIAENTMANLMEPPTLVQPNRGTPKELELPMVPTSDPVLPQLTFPVQLSEPAQPQSDAVGLADEKSNKNLVKRQTIRQKLEEAVAQGRLPQFCQNCGALQTPTWRKIWKRACVGVPAYHEYSEKPGHVTAINIISRDASDKPTMYEIIKKSLGPLDNKPDWTEILLCNPCGIWFSKFKQHRPADKWEKDEQRLSQTRRKRPNGSAPPRSKKARTKSDTQTNLTSEACLPTDPLGPPDGPSSLGNITAGPTSQAGQDKVVAEANCQGSTHSRHSRGSGTPGSPIAVDDDLGATRRVLFPSPRKEGESRVLGEVAVNIVQTSPEYHGTKGERLSEKENNDVIMDGDIFIDDDFADIFGTPPRPSTPPPKMSSGGPFKTPTHPTPGHRPVTRSVTRSMRSVRSINSPSELLMMDHTPTRTPRSSAAKRHSPGDLMPSHLLNSQLFDTPMTRSINHLMSNLEQAGMPQSPPRWQLDLSSLPSMDELEHTGPLNFGQLLNNDIGLSSSPPIRRHGGQQQKGYGNSSAYERTANYFDELDTGTAHMHGAGRNNQNTR